MTRLLKFLTELYEEGKGYSALNVARSSISTLTVDSEKIGAHPLVCKFMRGVFNLRPSLPRNVVTWDADQVLILLEKWGPAKFLSLRQLTLKVTLLLLLLSGQRGQTIWLIDIRNITVCKGQLRIRFGDLLKTSTPKCQQHEIVLSAYPPNRRLCIVTYMKAYLDRTAPLRQGETKLLLSYRVPHSRVSRDTVRRWTKSVMKEAGIDLEIFTPHSTRAASTSKVAGKIPLKTILQTAGWRRRSTFAMFYHKPVVKETGFSTAMLS